MVILMEISLPPFKLSTWYVPKITKRTFNTYLLLLDWLEAFREYAIAKEAWLSKHFLKRRAGNQRIDCIS
jgi:hypothetical protein